MEKLQKALVVALYLVLTPVLFQRKLYGAGELVEMPEELGDPLVDQGVLEWVEEVEAEEDEPEAPETDPLDPLSATETESKPLEPVNTTLAKGCPYPALSESTQLVGAILQLDPDRENAKHWTKSGVPQIDALEEISGLKDVSAADRDAAYEIYLEGKK